ncbi:MAG: hypothetical protein KJN77_08170 [Gammaproteobacteria bacterium]|nr:hypothetical protein [Gammaproteobacteria bacterium]
MKRANYLALSAMAVLGLDACGNGNVEQAAEADESVAKDAAEAKAKPEPMYDGTVSKPGAPFAMSYRIIGTPIVGSPVTVELRVESLLQSREIAVDYRINDASSMMLPEAQPARVLIEPAVNENFVVQRITVVPQREGRMYLNVAASVDSDDGAVSSIMAIPIQVGEGGRQLEEQGEVQLDEDGEAIRVLTND